MVKNAEIKPSAAEPAVVKNSKKKPAAIAGRLAGSLFLAAAVLGGGWYLYQNPQLLFKKKLPGETNPEIMRLTDRLNALAGQVGSLQAVSRRQATHDDVAALQNRIDALSAAMDEKIEKVSRLNRDILDSKAGNSAVLNLVSRVDGLEAQVREMGKISSRGALVLTAAMLVKESAGSGQPFEYEAEVLRQLAAGTNMAAPAETIARFAAEGITGPKGLIAEFNRLYDEKQRQTANAVPLPVDGKTAAPLAPDNNAAQEKSPENLSPVAENDGLDGWKEKISSKLSQLIIIERHDDVAADEPALVHDRIYVLVNQGKLQEASALMKNDPAYQTQDFIGWQAKVAAGNEFDRALRKIQALTLAVMKAENLKPGVGNAM